MDIWGVILAAIILVWSVILAGIVYFVVCFYEDVFADLFSRAWQLLKDWSDPKPEKIN